MWCVILWQHAFQSFLLTIKYIKLDLKVADEEKDYDILLTFLYSNWS